MSYPHLKCEPGNSAHIANDNAGRIRNRRNADAISRFVISNDMPGKGTCSETRNRANAPKDGTGRDNTATWETRGLFGAYLR